MSRTLNVDYSLQAVTCAVLLDSSRRRHQVSASERPSSVCVLKASPHGHVYLSFAISGQISSIPRYKGGLAMKVVAMCPS